MRAAVPAAAVHYLAPGALDLAAILPAPPAPGSLAAQADLETVLQAQAWRTPEQVAWAKVTEKADVFDNASVLGGRFAKNNLPATAVFFENLGDDVYAVGEAAKNLYLRARPFQADARVQPCTELPTSNSYPSRHVLFVYVWAGVLAEIFPEQRVELFDRAHRAAWGRVLAGVHFPTDLEGGRRLAEATVTELKKIPAFRAAIEKCRAEVAAAALRKAA